MRRRARLAALALSGVIAGCGTAEAPPHSAAVVAQADEVEAAGVRLVPSHDLYVVNTDAELVGIARRDPNDGCTITYLAPEFRIDNPLVSTEATRFVNPCHGDEYDITGAHLPDPASSPSLGSRSWSSTASSPSTWMRNRDRHLRRHS